MMTRRPPTHDASGQLSLGLRPRPSSERVAEYMERARNNAQTTGTNPNELQLKEMENGSFNLVLALDFIRRNIKEGQENKHAKLIFGGADPVQLSDVLFDLNKPKDCYALCEKVQERNEEPTENLKKPLIIILPQALKNTKNGLEFKTCVATGKNGYRHVIPVLQSEKPVHKNTKLIAMVSDFSLLKADNNMMGELTYMLNFTVEPTNIQPRHRADLDVASRLHMRMNLPRRL